ncbi:hypothetical protein SOVF_051670 [Spinacia oleracea]|uniref:RING-type E3 ubiquitin transferase n=1 Tax=Spinacia oleracea TaxID=3562 RepID=A0A9R0JIE0_SPIOL|nr:RING-H2 finger protein ATL73-like [Spinacia oleracea]KNA20512.1 hypothetical protein SOVF_051670 [Spinacia oleracea]
MAWALPHHRLFGETPPPIPMAISPCSNEGRDARVNIDIDANMVVILAVLLCALLCALGLNSIVRCALRCLTGQHHHRHRQEVSEAYVGSVNRGLKRSTIRQIPTTIYRIATSVMSTDCMICLGEFTEGENIKVLPKCKHGYHSKCIDTWLLSHSTCPTCRQSLSEWAGNGAILVSVGVANPTNQPAAAAAGDAAQS